MTHHGERNSDVDVHVLAHGEVPVPPDSLQMFQSGLPAQLIATPREQLVTCHETENLTDVIERNRNDGFDFLPVTDRPNKEKPSIVGILETAAVMDMQGARGTVHDAMKPLSEGYLLAADTSIVDFVREADVHPCRLTVSGHGISGLVCIYDMQKLPVRAALFAMVAQIEMAMAAMIESVANNPSEWMKYLSSGRQDNLEQEIKRAKTEDAFVNALLCTQFGDKVTILQKNGVIKKKKEFKRDLETIQRLRDKLVHANEYARTRKDCETVCDTVRRLESWLDYLGDRMPVAQS